MRVVLVIGTALLLPSLAIAAPGLRSERPLNPLIEQGLQEQARGTALQTRGAWLISTGDVNGGAEFQAKGDQVLREGIRHEVLGEQKSDQTTEHRDSHKAVGSALGLWSEAEQLTPGL